MRNIEYSAKLVTIVLYKFIIVYYLLRVDKITSNLFNCTLNLTILAVNTTFNNIY